MGYLVYINGSEVQGLDILGVTLQISLTHLDWILTASGL